MSEHERQRSISSYLNVFSRISKIWYLRQSVAQLKRRGKKFSCQAEEIIKKIVFTKFLPELLFESCSVASSEYSVKQ